VRVVTVGDETAVENYEGIAVHVMRSPNVYWNYMRTPRAGWRKVIWHLLENFNPVAYFRLRPHVKTFAPDVVMTVSIENVNVATWLLAWLHSIPVVHVIQSYFLMCWRGGLFKNNDNCVGQCAGCKALSFGKKPLSRLVNGVFGETNFVLNAHLQQGYFVNAQAAVIPGMIFPIASRVPKRREGPLVVGYMGVLEPHKGVDVLAQAAASLGAHSNIRFLIAGTGESPDYVARLQQVFGAADVDFLGWSQPGVAYPQFDVLVVPSKWKEPFGRIVVEAFSYGIPVVCARSGGVSESVRDGFDGYTFESGDAQQLASILKDLLEADEPLRYTLACNALLHSKDYALAPVAHQIDLFLTSVTTEYQAHSMPKNA